MVEIIDLFEQVTEDDLQEIHDKKCKEKRLSPQDWEVYRLIYHNSIVENRKTTQKEICDKIEGFTWNDDPLVHDHCSKVWTSIKNNNESFEHEKIIISHNFEYWIGSEEETKVFMDKLWNDLAPRLSRYWTYLSKIKRNGQGKLFSTSLKPIDESKAREFVESFKYED